jgi:tetratricopeptide (TPR) repeat protein
MSTVETAATTTVPHEKPLGKSARWLLMLSAALAIGLFYLYAACALICLPVLLGVEIVIAAALARFGAIRLITPTIETHGRLLGLLAGSFWRRKQRQFQVPIQAADAPGLFALLERLAHRLVVPVPRKVVLEMNSGAWVKLKGLRNRSATELGLGYDLVAGLNQAELEAVLAHEMSHAKLVRRGFKLWLNLGLGHAANFTGRLAALVHAHRRASKNIMVGEVLLAPADRCTRLAARLVATYSRQDEFDADAGAAALCGAAPLSSSLRKLDSIVAVTSRISWSERVSRLQNPGGLGNWLAGLLANQTVTDDEPHVADAHSTHPSISDRIAALGGAANAPVESPGAIGLFRDPDGIAQRLVAEIHLILEEEERKDSKALKKWLRKLRTSRDVRPEQVGGFIFMVAGFFLVCGGWGDNHDATLIGVGLALGIGGFFLFRARLLGPRRVAELPVPDYEILAKDHRLKLEKKELEARELEIKTALIAVAPATPKSAKNVCLTQAALTALETCDYLRARVASRTALANGAKQPEALFACAIACAALGDASSAGTFLRAGAKASGVKTPSAQWGAAWTLMLLHDFAGAEALLEEALKAWPNNANLHAVIARAQGHRNKRHSAIGHARIALAALPGSAERTRLLASLLLRAGDVRETERVLQGAGAVVGTDPDLITLMIRVRLHQQAVEEANRWLGILGEHGLNAVRRIEIGAAYEGARCDDRARELYTATLAEAFYPAAHLGLARLDAVKRDTASARQHILDALDSTKPLGTDAVGPLPLFLNAVGQLNQLRDPVSGAQSWIVRFTSAQVAGPLAKEAFLVYAVDQASAVAVVKEVADALRPKEPSLLPQYVSWELAPRDQQPIGVVKPGIVRTWKT